MPNSGAPRASRHAYQALLFAESRVENRRRVAEPLAPKEHRRRPTPAARPPWVDPEHLVLFVADRCANSPYGIRLGAVYNDYLNWAADQQGEEVVSGGIFTWWMRQRFDSAKLGTALGGEWVLGLGLRERESSDSQRQEPAA